MSSNNQFYQLRISKAKVLESIDDERFVLAIKLCRFSNQISFLLSSYPDEESRVGSPTDSLRTFNTLLFLTSVLHEALKFLRQKECQLSANFKSYKDGVTRLRNLEEFERTESLVKVLRDQAVSHVDERQIRKTSRWLHKLMSQPSPFVTMGADGKEFHYQFADDLALNFLIGEHSVDESGREVFQQKIHDLQRVAREYMRFSTNMINEFMEDSNFPLTEVE